MAIEPIDRAVAAADPATAAPRHGSSRPVSASWRRHLKLLLPGLAALAMLGPATFLSNSPAAAESLTAVGACATGVGNAGGEGIICEVTIVNTITATGGSAVVTVHECLGSAGDPTDGALGHFCTTTTTNLAAPVTSVIQCDGSANGAGGALRCSVSIMNNFTDISPGDTTLTVNQCVGSGGTTGCNPLESTTGAAITQCNGSDNGGTLVQLTCTATGTMSSTLPVTIDQCNGSGSGGGALVICSASMVNNAILSPSDSPPPDPTASPSAPPSDSPPPDPTASPSAPPSDSPPPDPTASPSRLIARVPPVSSTRASSGPNQSLADATAAAGDPAPPDTSTDSSNSGTGTSPLLPLAIPLAASGLFLVAISERRTSPTR
jgi:hypothetical protein